MSASPSQNTLVIHASRVPNVGGLHAFTESVLRCAASSEMDAIAVVGEGVVVPERVQKLTASPSITMIGASSWPRSLRGFLYSILFSWQHRGQHVLSTTHLGLPGHRRQILTVHDVRPRMLPDSWVHTLYFRFMLPTALRRACGVITVSETSKTAIAQTYSIAPEKIHVVPNVVRTVTPAAGHADDAPYLLMVNAVYSHKNAKELLTQHALWRPRYRLKILAGDGAYRDELRTFVRTLGLEAHVDFFPQVADEELAALYTHAAAVVYPSLMEGFGLPPLEAMAYGTPAIVSDIPVFREVFADAPLFVQLGDVESWKRALEGIDSARTPERIAYARTVAGRYTDARMCEALTRALRAVWKSGPR